VSNIGNNAEPEHSERSPKLVGRLTTLSRFMPRLVEKIIPILKRMKKTERFEWKNMCEMTFSVIKGALTTFTILAIPTTEEPMMIYLGVCQKRVN